MRACRRLGDATRWQMYEVSREGPCGTHVELKLTGGLQRQQQKNDRGVHCGIGVHHVSHDVST